MSKYNSLQGKMNTLLHDVTFLPSPEQRKCKAAFWASYADNPLWDRNNINLTAAKEVTGDTRLSHWWKQEGFVPWFTNKEEFRQRVEYLANLALDTIEDVLLDSEANTNARIKASQLMLEAASKMPDKHGGKEKYADAQISEMGVKELQAWLERQGVKLLGSEADEDK